MEKSSDRSYVGIRGLLDPRLRTLIEAKSPYAHFSSVLENRSFYVSEGSEFRGSDVPRDSSIHVCTLVGVDEGIDDMQSVRATLEAAGARRAIRVAPGIWSVDIRIAEAKVFAGCPIVSYVEVARPIAPGLTRSVPALNLSAEAPGEDPMADATDAGQPVVIGIVDYGLDWTLPDFCEADDPGRSRIRFLWDQSLRAQRGESPPPHFGHGVEYSSTTINEALSRWRGGDPGSATELVRHRPWPSSEELRTDVTGHGTHVTGIAAGNGSGPSQGCDRCSSDATYRGVAPNAVIVFVNIDRPEIQDFVASAGTTLVDSGRVAEGIAYCFHKADEIAKQLERSVPCVVNLSMGFNGGSHDGETMLERVIDALVRQQRGRAVVVGAGNEADQKIHAAGPITEVSATDPLIWFGANHNEPDPTPNELEIWFSSRNEIGVRLRRRGEAAGHAAEFTLAEPGAKLSSSTDDGFSIIMDYDRFTPLNGDSRVYILVAPPPGGGIFGEWEIFFEPRDTPEDFFDAWIEKETGIGAREPRDPRQSRFKGSHVKACATVTSPGTTRYGITVGGLGRDAQSLYVHSGRGWSRDGRKKPELSAPAMFICSNDVMFDREGHTCARVEKTGTSMAAPHLAGLIARMLARAPDLSVTQIRAILVASALQSSNGSTEFEPTTGFGLVDGRRAVELARDAGR